MKKPAATKINREGLEFKISDDLSTLIEIFHLSSGGIKQRNYKRIKDASYIAKLNECRGYEEDCKMVDSRDEYFVLRQRDIDNHFTGIVKIVKKTEATVKKWRDVRIKAEDTDWIYYKRERA